MAVELRQQVCDGHLFKLLMAAGLAWLEHNMEQVNRMNVFPVPDGDTGTNMYHTMKRAYSEIEDSQDEHVGIVSAAFARGALYGARGNSGTILSQIFRGFAAALNRHEIFDAELLNRAVQTAVDTAYDALKAPQEGTILTVVRDVSRQLSSLVDQEHDLSVLLEKMITAAHDSLRRTPELLPILKQSGVVDSGGMGLVFILEGMQRLITGQQVHFQNNHHATPSIQHEGWEHALQPEDEAGYGYDVQFLMRGEGLNVMTVRQAIEAMGWSTLVVGDSNLIKVHVHVHDPGEPLSYAIGQGAQIDDVVVENMQAQYEQYVIARRNQQIEAKPKQVDGVAVITVVNGEGLHRLYDELDAAYIIRGGQTMNPSAEDFIHAIESLPNDEIILLPNNRNIILAANQAAQLVKDKTVHVLPTKTIPQGISAMISYGDHRDSSTVDTLLETMVDAIQHVVTGEVTHAIRSSEQNGVRYEEGQLIGLLNDRIVAAGDDVATVLQRILQQANTEDYEIVTLYYGSAVSAEDAAALSEHFSSLYPDVEFVVVDGGQPLYPLIVSVE